MEMISFKAYWESKEKLRESLLTSPIYKISYSVKKPAKIFVGEGDRISLRPNDTIIIEWNYENPDCPIPTKMELKEGTYSNVSKLSPSKLRKWLIRNTIEEY